jgi:NAD+ synthetase
MDALALTPLQQRCQTWSQLAHARNWSALDALNQDTLNTLKQAWQGKGLLATLQWNPIAGDVAGNETLVRLAMQFAEALGADALVLPEQTLLGYPLRDMLLRFPKLVKDNESALARLALESAHTRVLVGFAERRYDLAEGWGSAWGKPYYNSVAILGDGLVQGVVRKSLLPNYHEFEDSRVFEASETLGVQRWGDPHPNPLPEGEGAGQGAVALEPSPLGSTPRRWRATQGEGHHQLQWGEDPHPNLLPEGEGTEPPLPLGEGWGEGPRKMLKLHPNYLERIRQLRKNQTNAEQLLWALIRDRQLANHKFRRQHPLPPYIADFYCHEAKVVIELDGGQHHEDQALMYDAQRTKYLEEQGLSVLRFANQDVLTKTQLVLETLYSFLESTGPHPNPLPEGEGAGQGAVALEPSPSGSTPRRWRATQGEGGSAPHERWCFPHPNLLPEGEGTEPPLDPLDAYGNITIHGRKFAITVCEDLWAKEPNQHPWYQQNVVNALMQGRPDLLVNLSSSPSRAGKEFRRQALLSDVATHHKVPILYVNQVGAVDELIFDGGSRLVGADGQVLSRSKLFETQFSLHHVSEAAFHHHENWVPNVEQSQRSSPEDVFEPYDESDLPRTYAALTCGIRDYFQKCGFKRAVLGLSGGLDSAVNAVLVADALGAENVLAFSFPSELTPADNKSDALQLAQNLGIGWVEIPISAMQSAFLGGIHNEREALEALWGKPSSESFAQDNVQAMSRATLLRLIGNDYRALPIATSDKSEFYMGYATVNGDMSGALAPLGDVSKTKVRALARWMNQHHAMKGVIPQAVVERPSGGDLAVNPQTGQLLTAEEALMPYEVIDELIWRIEAHGMDASELKRMVWSWELKHGVLTEEQKSAWVNKFFKRMQASVFKWWVAPPMLLVDADGSLAKSAYHPVITAMKTLY